MKKIGILIILLAITFSLTACGNNSRQAKENSSLAAENSSLKAKKHRSSSSESKKKSPESTDSDNASESAQSTGEAASQQSTTSNSSNTIGSAQDAENLIEHSMHTEPGTYSAVPTGDGYLVNGSGGSAYVHNDGSVTWSNGDNQSYASVAAPTSN